MHDAALYTELNRCLSILDMSYGECTGLSQEDLSKKDLLLDYFMGTISSVFHRISSIITRHKSSVLEDYVRMHRRAVDDVLNATDIPYAKIILPSPQGMVWPYLKTIDALDVLYKNDPPKETVAFLKQFSSNLDHRDRIALASTLADLERDKVTTTTEVGLTDLFVSNALGHKTGDVLFGDHAGFKKVYTKLSSMGGFYSDGVNAATEIKSLEDRIRRTISAIIDGSGIDKDSAAMASKTLRLLCTRLRTMASLLVKMDTVEQNFTMCLRHLVDYRNKTQ